ncbi:dna topoisomerase mitochondrial isoform x2 [Limosa lapponica baueri]|uniref:Dna topoisomerase mitochondrial isoform x2 n=1 Tax=Limosa lapponica baueri TaxID=1758121 RepID=A0A2I0T0L9_LIMLA|nr:dna topoisomerase mitochondrial isoform x2 [Limosa lapponica baueri]
MGMVWSNTLCAAPQNRDAHVGYWVPCGSLVDGWRPCGSNVEKKKKLLKRLEEQLAKLNVQATDKEENKQIALGTSKLNYLDPRISIAW